MKHRLLPLIVTALLAACGESQAPAGPPAAGRITDPAIIARGAQIFGKNCASCHGDRAQGAFRWEHPGADGRYPPPPLDGSAHAWHHPQAALEQVIRSGTQAQGGNMPAWGGKLKDADIRAVIAWFQSLWPDPIYAAWVDMDRRARTGRR
jgi:mono/diheme cytochrome c family protein